ncbi:MAG TPA: MqnA/MqnD/SBP family protein [Chthoniobacteraceae bacterium]|nr:MqnA/MqnD/SBP family protein [Chthoniobacteraceae bacterium]
MSTLNAQQTFTLGHSPDPDDAFMFYAMAEEKIDLRGYRFEHILQDIQTLNERATRGELHISAISIHAYAYVLDKYALLPCGASMGDGYGPMLIATGRDGLAENASDDAIREWLKGKRIAVPGTMTSAYLALQLFLGADHGVDTVVVPFDEIFDHVRSGKSPVGLIIHEGQVTYARDGFTKIRDFGEWWKEETGLPLPLGGNVIRKDLDPALRLELSDLLHESVRYGLEHRQAGVAHAMPLARDMDTTLADKFIGMYVNDYTLDYGEKGRESIRLFLQRASERNLIPAPVELEFVE